MKKKIISIVLLVALSFGIFGYQVQEAQANDAYLGAEIDYSFLTTQEALIGQMQMQTRGVYLSQGTSSITKISSTTIGAGGTTIATQKCNVSILVIVEKLNNGSWGYWTSWQASESYDISVMTGRSVYVSSGYYYRVRCTHKASTDTSSSWTGGLWVS